MAIIQHKINATNVEELLITEEGISIDDSFFTHENVPDGFEINGCFVNIDLGDISDHYGDEGDTVYKIAYVYEANPAHLNGEVYEIAGWQHYKGNYLREQDKSVFPRSADTYNFDIYPEHKFYLKAGNTIMLQREFNNEHDKNAIAVILMAHDGQYMLGYLKARNARLLAQEMSRCGITTLHAELTYVHGRPRPGAWQIKISEGRFYPPFMRIAE